MRQSTPVTSAPNVPSIMLREENIHTILIVDKIDHFMSYLPPSYRNGCHAQRLSTYLWRAESSLMEVC